MGLLPSLVCLFGTAYNLQLTTKETIPLLTHIWKICSSLMAILSFEKLSGADLKSKNRKVVKIGKRWKNRVQKKL